MKKLIYALSLCAIANMYGMQKTGVVISDRVARIALGDINVSYAVTNNSGRKIWFQLDQVLKSKGSLLIEHLKDEKNVPFKLHPVSGTYELTPLLTYLFVTCSMDDKNGPTILEKEIGVKDNDQVMVNFNEDSSYTLQVAHCQTSNIETIEVDTIANGLQRHAQQTAKQ